MFFTQTKLTLVGVALGFVAGCSAYEEPNLSSVGQRITTTCDTADCCPAGYEVTLLSAERDTQMIGGHACILAGYGDDTVHAYGTEGAWVSAGFGNDTIAANGGPSTVFGGPGNDIIATSSADDEIRGDEGNDNINAGTGNDIIFPGEGIDTVHAGAGDDTVHILGACEVLSGELIDGGSGNDELVIPVPLVELEALGAQFVGFETVTVTDSPIGEPQCESASEAESEYSLAEDAEISINEDGTFEIDASGKKGFLQLDAAPRRFADRAEFLYWLESELGAELEYDEDGHPIGAHGKSLQSGEPYYMEQESLVQVEDPVLAYVGGQSGTVVIGTDAYCLDENKCPPGVSYADPKGCDGNFCTDNTSFKTNAFFYNALGSKTKQTSGGFSKRWKVCRWAIFPYPCTETSGSNRMQIFADFKAKIPGTYGSSTI